MIVEILTSLARDLLSDHGGVAPRSEVVAWIEDRLAESPVGSAPPGRVDEGIESVLHDGPLIRVGMGPDAQIVDLTVVTEHVALTHRVTADEITSNRLDLDEDLAVLARVAQTDGGLHLADGTPLALRTTRDRPTGTGDGVRVRRHLVGPDGWLSDHAPGSILVATAADGFLGLRPPGDGEAVPTDDATVALADGLREPIAAALAQAQNGDETPVQVEEIQAAGLVDGWHEPEPESPPFGDLLVAVGLELSGDLVGEAASWSGRSVVTDYIAAHARHGDHLDTAELKGVTNMLDAFRAWRADPTATPDRHVVTRLHRTAEGSLCLEEELVRADPDGVELTAFLASLPRPGTKADAVLDTLQALAEELTGTGASAEPLLDAAIATSPDWFPATEARAHLFEVRGRSQEAINLLQTTRASSDMDLQVLRLRNKLTNPSVGRNDPCPCGSGRKYKQCHQGTVLMPPEVRVAWVLDKARAHLNRLGPLALADGLSVRNDLHQDAEVMALDVVLFDLGVLERFLDARRELLPADEVALVEGWVAGQRPALYRVGASDELDAGPTGGGGVVELVDVDSGDAFRVQRVDQFDDVGPDDVVWCRLLPDGDVWWTSGFVRPVDDDEAQVLAAVAAGAGEPGDRYQALLGLVPSVRIDASDGEPLVVATASWPVGTDRAAAEARLDEAGVPRDGALWTLVVDGEDVATVTLLDPIDLSGLSEEMAEDPASADLEQVLVVAHADSVRRIDLACEVAESLFPGRTLAHFMVVPIARHRARAVDDDLLEHLYADADEFDDEFDDLA